MDGMWGIVGGFLDQASGSWLFGWTTTGVVWSLKASVILLVATVLSVAFHRVTASLRHRVWLVALVSILALPFLEAGLPSLPVLPAVALPASGEGVVALVPAAPVVAEARDVERAAPQIAEGAARATAVPVVEAPAVLRGEPVSGQAASLPAAPRSPAAAEAVSRIQSSRGVEPEPLADGEPAAASLWSLAATVASFTPLVWLLGFIAWVGLVAAGLGRIRWLFLDGGDAPPRIRRATDAVRASLGVRRSVQVRISQGVPVPVTWGWAKPKLLLPEACLTWDSARLLRVLTHEIAHVKRGDWIAGLLAELTRALHWFNPLVWLAVAKLRIEQERACDDRVLGLGTRPSDYAMDLLDVARGRSVTLAGATVVPLARPGTLSRRVRELLDPSRRRSREAPLKGALFNGGLLVAFVPVAMLSAVGAADPVQSAVPVLEGRAAVEPLPAVVPVVEARPGLGRSAVVERLTAVAPMLPDPEVAPVLLPLIQEVDVCVFRPGGRHSTSVHVDDDDDWRIKWESEECEVEVTLRGRLVFNETEDGIASMERGARFEVRERSDRGRRRLLAEGEADGTPSYRFWRDGDETEFDAAGRSWFAAFLPELFRHTTIQAEERVARIFAGSGTRGVLDEVGRMGSDHVAARYLGLLMEQRGFQASEVPLVLDLTADRIGSDHYTSEILATVGERWGIRAEYRESYLNAVRGIGSDHYTHEALIPLLDAEDLPPGVISQVIEAAGGIGSDHYRASLLTRVADRGRIPDADREAYVDAVRAMGSDHYRHETINRFMDRGPLESAEVIDVLELSAAIGSDHYRAELLTRVGTEVELEGPEISAFLRSAAGIDSDHYAGEVGRVLVRRNELTAEQVGLVLDLVEGISSDHQRSELMIDLVGRHALDDGQRARYRELAMQIGSRHSQDRALAALARAQR